MSRFVTIITSSDPVVRNQPVDRLCSGMRTEELLQECAALDRFRRSSPNLYERVRAQTFLQAVYRFHLEKRPELQTTVRLPYEASSHILNRRFEEAIDMLLRTQQAEGLSGALASGFALAYRALAFKTLAGQVRQSVRSVRGNHWMSRIGHPDDYPLSIRPELRARPGADSPFPLLKEATPVRMDLTHSAWSDIFFLGMDYPEGARVLNVSIDLAVRDTAGANGEQARPQPPVEAYLRIIDEPVLRLTSIDLGATADITTFAEVFDFGRDYLGLLKAAVIASGIVPPAMEGALQPLRRLLARLAGEGHGLELVSRVRDIPKGSRLAVSTNLLAGLIAVCMRATHQVEALTGPLAESDRRLVAARAILGEWLGGSGGGWQDSGGVWPGIKLIEGAEAQSDDAEWGISRGRLLPSHHVFSRDEISQQARQKLQDSLVLVHGGMAQDVGPILEMVTEKYLLRSEREWTARQDALAALDAIVSSLRDGDVQSIGAATEANFFGPIQTIIPWATNRYTELLIERVRADMGSAFWGFWMLGGMAGGGMGFIFEPSAKAAAQARLAVIMQQTKRMLEDAVPFAMDPVVYDFAINETGTAATLLTGDDCLLPESYYTLTVPSLLRVEQRLMPPSRRAELHRFSAACRTKPAYSRSVELLFERILPSGSRESESSASSLAEVLQANGFDPLEHQQIQTDLRDGRIGLQQNRLPSTTVFEDARREDVLRFDGERAVDARALGLKALADGKVAVVSMAGGAGTRWTRGAGVVKALNPFAKLGGQFRNFVEVHLAKSRHATRLTGTSVPHVITTSYLTHDPVARFLEREGNCGYEGPLLLSAGRSIGLRLIPTVRDLRFAWEDLAQQTLDEQKQKVRDSARSALIRWAQQQGEGTDYTDNLALQCIHPTGHWYELPNMLRNGVLSRLLQQRPQLQYLLLHNIDTVGVSVDPTLLGLHIEAGVTMTVEVIARHVDDHGGGLARVDSRLRLVEGMALPSERIESTLSWYNSNTFWIELDRLLAVFQLTREDLEDQEKVRDAVRALALRMPTYVTLKEVKKRWGKGQEDVLPIAQFEKLFVDMTALSEVSCAYIAVPRARGQQLKEPAQLDGWLRDGSAAYVEALADWS